MQGHLTRFLSFGLGLSVTAIEADHTLVAMASRFDGQLMWVLEKEKQKQVCCRSCGGQVELTWSRESAGSAGPGSRQNFFTYFSIQPKIQHQLLSV